MLSSLQIFTRDIKKEKVTLLISRHKRILNKLLFYEHSNIEERDDILKKQEHRNTKHQRNTKEQQTTEHRQNSGTLRNNGGTMEQPGTQAEHPRITTEHQRKTSKTPLNNGTTQNKEQV